MVPGVAGSNPVIRPIIKNARRNGGFPFLILGGYGVAPANRTVTDQVPLRAPPTKSDDFAGAGSGWHTGKCKDKIIINNNRRRWRKKYFDLSNYQCIIVVSQRGRWFGAVESLYRFGASQFGTSLFFDSCGFVSLFVPDLLQVGELLVIQHGSPKDRRIINLYDFRTPRPPFRWRFYFCVVGGI